MYDMSITRVEYFYWKLFVSLSVSIKLEFGDLISNSVGIRNRGLLISVIGTSGLSDTGGTSNTDTGDYANLFISSTT